MLRTAVVAPLLVVALAACGDDADTDPTDPTDPVGPVDDPAEEPSTAPDPTGSWRMADGPVPPIDGWDVTVTIDGEQIGGTAACNTYGGTVAWDEDGSFSVGELAQTEMACEPAAVMDLERVFLTSLAGATEFAVAGDRLTLVGDGDTWTFELLPPAPTADLVDTTWQLDGYVTGDAVSNELGMDGATLVLGSDGTVTGSTNCRSLSGTWVESGTEILLTELSAEGACPDAPASDLDGRILEVLGDGFIAEIDGRRLTLTSQGGVGLTYTATTG
jgi:heat shock protein HslJ